MNLFESFYASLYHSRKKERPFSDLLKDIFGKRGGRAIGKIIARIGAALFYPFVRYTVGTDSNYKKSHQRLRCDVRR